MRVFSIEEQNKFMEAIKGDRFELAFLLGRFRKDARIISIRRI